MDIAQRLKTYSNNLVTLDSNKEEAVAEVRERFEEIIDDFSEFMDESHKLVKNYVTDVNALTEELNKLKEKIRWHELTKEKPEIDRDVEVCSADGKNFSIGWMCEEGRFWDKIGDEVRFKPVYWRYLDVTLELENKPEPTAIAEYSEKIARQNKKISELNKQIDSLECWKEYSKEKPEYDDEPVLCAIETLIGEHRIGNYKKDKFVDESGTEIKDVRYWYNLSNLYLPDEF